MPRPLAALALVCCGLSLASCSDDTEDPIPVPERETLVVETIYMGLGTAETYSYQRREAVRDVLSTSPADVLCMTGIWDATARTAIVDALDETFAFWVALPTNDATVVDDPSLPDGSVPDPPTSPPCTPQQQDAVAQVLGCLGTSCSDQQFERGAFGGVCFAELGPCRADFDTLQSPSDPLGRCGACIAAHARAGDRIEDMRERCTKLVGDPLARHGDSGLLVLSKLPIAAADLYVMPAQSLRRAAITVEVQSSAGRAIDITCATLGPTAPKGVTFDPSTDDEYPGPYGGWLKEHDLQLEKLLSHLAPRRAKRPGIVMGAWGDSPSLTLDGVALLDGSGEDSVEKLGAKMVMAVPDGYQANCTLCPQNRIFQYPLLPDASWPNRIYLDGVEDAIVSSATRTYLGNVVQSTVFAPAAGYLPDTIPLPLVYGFRSVVELPLP